VWGITCITWHYGRTSSLAPANHRGPASRLHSTRLKCLYMATCDRQTPYHTAARNWHCSTPIRSPPEDVSQGQTTGLYSLWQLSNDGGRDVQARRDGSCSLLPAAASGVVISLLPLQFVPLFCNLCGTTTDSNASPNASCFLHMTSTFE
jgi:hypothetical protein